MFFFDYANAEMFPQIWEVVRDAAERGHPIDSWAFEIVRPDDSGYVVFVDKKNRMYRSQCPHYQGKYLDGGASSVKCAASDDLLPGLQYDVACRENHECCIFFRRQIGREQKQAI